MGRLARVSQTFYKERLGTKSPPHPPQCAHWGTFPPRGRLWGDEPDLETFFHKNAFQHIFPRKMRPKSVLAYRRQQPFDRTKANQPQTQRVGTSGHKTRGPGAQPRPSFSPFLGRNGDPRRVGGATGRCAPRHRKSPDHPKGTQYRTAPPPGAGRARAYRSRPPKGHAAPGCPWQGGGLGPAQGPAGTAGRNLRRKCPRRPPRWEGRLGQ